MAERYGLNEDAGDVEGSEWEYETEYEEDPYLGGQYRVQIYHKGKPLLDPRPYFSSESDAAGFAVGYVYRADGWLTENPFFL